MVWIGGTMVRPIRPLGFGVVLQIGSFVLQICDMRGLVLSSLFVHVCWSGFRQDPDSAWAKRNSSGKLDGREEVPNTIPSKPSIFGRGFSLSWRDKSKVWGPHKENSVL